jgi:hypothetical protein
MAVDIVGPSGRNPFRNERAAGISTTHAWKIFHP